ncbi:MAG: hypothetical protein LUE90_09720 [Clostridiales bacterium]|nr:hypothetical protein [Clostridiales bacterium]
MGKRFRNKWKGFLALALALAVTACSLNPDSLGISMVFASSASEEAGQEETPESSGTGETVQETAEEGADSEETAAGETEESTASEETGQEEMSEGTAAEGTAQEETEEGTESGEIAAAEITVSAFGYSSQPVLGNAPLLTSAGAEEMLWWYEIYYVNEDDLYDVSKTDNFKLKYQFEFHNSTQIEEGTLEIRIDAGLLQLRDGSWVLPTDIGVPYGTPGSPTTSSKVPFNYYYVVKGESTPLSLDEAVAAAAAGTELELVFFNYTTIASGTDISIQVLYPEIDVMQVEDMSTWEIESVATVDNNGTEETQDGTTLTCDVDTRVILSGVSKTAYDSSSLSYTP